MSTKLAIRNLSKSVGRFQSQVTPLAKKTATGLSREELEANPNALQAPNRKDVWTGSQQPRADAIARNPHRFIQRDLDKQPQPYSAMELIAKQPVRYIHEGNVAVCDGNKGSTLQGHPKIFINLDQPKPATCGYCGLRYAKEEHRLLIECEQK